MYHEIREQNKSEKGDLVWVSQKDQAVLILRMHY